MLFRVVSVSLLGLVLSVSLASAECAWVLWQKESSRHNLVKKSGDSVIPPTWKELWTIERSFQKFADCEATRSPQLRQWMNVMAKSFEVSVVDDGRKASALKRAETSVSVSSELARLLGGTTLAEDLKDATQETQVLVEFMCLPDTIDPRRPKGK